MGNHKRTMNTVIRKILEIVKKDRLTPTQLRYVFKRVREDGNYQIPKAKRKLPDFLSMAEIYTVRKVINEKFKAEDGFLFDFLVGTGLRIGEFTKLMITDLDFGNSTIKVPLNTKTGNRFVPFPMSLQQKTKLFINKRQRGYLFVKADNTKYTERGLQKRITNILKACNFSKKLSTHSLRHTYATVLRANGVKLQDIQTYLGHASIKNTEIYAHLTYDAEQQRQIMQIMDN